MLQVIRVNDLSKNNTEKYIQTTTRHLKNN